MAANTRKWLSQITKLADLPASGSVLGGLIEHEEGVKVAAFSPQVMATYRVSVGNRLLADARKFSSFVLPAGGRLREVCAAAVLPGGSVLGDPGSSAAAPAAAGGLAGAQQAMAAFMPPAAGPAQPAVGGMPPTGMGLTPGSPAAVPGHAAIKSVIQKQGPISTTGDFGNPNAGQGVKSGAGRRRWLAAVLGGAAIWLLVGVGLGADPVAPVGAVRATVTAVHDADTLTAVAHLPFGVDLRSRAWRAYGYDAWEVDHTRKTVGPISNEEIKAGKAARDDLAQLLSTVGFEIYLEEPAGGAEQTYDRLEAIWWVRQKDGTWIWLAGWMRDRGHIRTPLSLPGKGKVGLDRSIIRPEFQHWTDEQILADTRAWIRRNIGPHELRPGEVVIPAGD